MEGIDSSQWAESARPNELPSHIADWCRFDDVSLFKSFGNVVTQPHSSDPSGSKVTAVFWGGHPKNNMLIGSSFADIERQNGSNWIVIARDNDPSKTYRWLSDGIAYSKIKTTWDTTSFPKGAFRIRHRGHWKSGWTGAISSYQGIVTNQFTIQ